MSREKLPKTARHPMFLMRSWCEYPGNAARMVHEHPLTRRGCTNVCLNASFSLPNVGRGVETTEIITRRSYRPWSNRHANRLSPKIPYATTDTVESCASGAPITSWMGYPSLIVRTRSSTSPSCCAGASDEAIAMGPRLRTLPPGPVSPVELGSPADLVPGGPIPLT